MFCRCISNAATDPRWATRVGICDILRIEWVAESCAYARAGDGRRRLRVSVDRPAEIPQLVAATVFVGAAPSPAQASWLANTRLAGAAIGTVRNTFAEMANIAAHAASGISGSFATGQQIAGGIRLATARRRESARIVTDNVADRGISRFSGVQWRLS